MKNIILLSALVGSTLVSGQLFAEGNKYGIGVGLNDGLQLYFPIQLDQIMIEPSVGIISNDDEISYGIYTEKLTYKVWLFELGIFKQNNVVNNASVYYGARLGYVKTKSEYSGSSTDNLDGYTISPTVGMEYFVTDEFSVGIDVAAEYSRTDEGDGYVNEKITRYSTQSEVIVRYRF